MHICILTQVHYNGRSVLESHHTATAITLLQRPELDFLHRMSPQVLYVVKIGKSGR